RRERRGGRTFVESPRAIGEERVEEDLEEARVGEPQTGSQTNVGKSGLGHARTIAAMQSRQIHVHPPAFSGGGIMRKSGKQSELLCLANDGRVRARDGDGRQ